MGISNQPSSNKPFSHGNFKLEVNPSTQDNLQRVKLKIIASGGIRVLPPPPVPSKTPRSPTYSQERLPEISNEINKLGIRTLRVKASSSSPKSTSFQTEEIPPPPEFNAPPPPSDKLPGSPSHSFTAEEIPSGEKMGSPSSPKRSMAPAPRHIEEPSVEKSSETESKWDTEITLGNLAEVMEKVAADGKRKPVITFDDFQHPVLVAGKREAWLKKTLISRTSKGQSTELMQNIIDKLSKELDKLVENHFDAIKKEKIEKFGTTEIIDTFGRHLGRISSIISNLENSSWGKSRFEKEPLLRESLNKVKEKLKNLEDIKRTFNNIDSKIEKLHESFDKQDNPTLEQCSDLVELESNLDKLQHHCDEIPFFRSQQIIADTFATEKTLLKPLIREAQDNIPKILYDLREEINELNENFSSIEIENLLKRTQEIQKGLNNLEQSSWIDIFRNNEELRETLDDVKGKVSSLRDRTQWLTKEELINRLTLPCEENLRKKMLVGYRWQFTTEELFQRLAEQVDEQEKGDIIREFCKEWLSDVRLHSFEYNDNNIQGSLCKIFNKERFEELIDEGVIDIRQDFLEPEPPQEKAYKEELGDKENELPLDQLINGKISGDDYRDLVNDVSDDMVVIFLKMLKRIHSKEFAKCVWMKENKKSPHLLEFIEFWNKSTDYIASQILRQPTDKGRKKLAKFFVDVANRSVEIGDFTSASAIQTALKKNYIFHLNLIDRNQKDYKKLVELYNSDNNYISLREKVEKANSILPINILNKDLFGLRTVNSELEDERINIDRMNAICSIQLKLLKAQSQIEPKKPLTFALDRDIEENTLSEEQLYTLFDTIRGR